jgi:hypothetical protein
MGDRYAGRGLQVAAWKHSMDKGAALRHEAATIGSQKWVASEADVVK